jgi:hypothetical protein
MIYAASIRADIDSFLAEVFIFSLMFSKAVSMSVLSLKFPKAAKLFEILF